MWHIGLVIRQLTLLTVCLAWSNSHDEQFPVLIPYPGFYLSPVSSTGAPGLWAGERPRLVLEVFIDMACKDSRAAWEAAQKVARMYHQHRVAVKIMQFPLPYHRNAMLLAQGALMVFREKPASLQAYVSMVFEHLEEWKTDNTANETDSQVRERLVLYTEQLTGLGDRQIRDGIRERDADVRNEWKLGCSRGVSGTPTMFVNGVRLQLREEVSFAMLSELLDRLLGLNDKEEVTQEEGAGGGGAGAGGGGRDLVSSANSKYKFW